MRGGRDEVATNDRPNQAESAVLSDSPFDEPDWTDPQYSHWLSPGERLAIEGSRGPGARDSHWLATADAAQLSAPDRLELLTLLDQQIRWLQAATIRTLAAVAAADPTAKKYSQESVSLALRIPVRTAQNRLRQAATLVRELPTTLDALGRGQVSHDQARTLTDAVWKLPPDEPDLVVGLEKAVLGSAPQQTTSQFRAAVKKATMRIDPASAEERYQRARSDRAVRLEPVDDGMALLSVLLDAPDAQVLYTRLTAAATSLPSTDPRTIDQQRADLFVDAVLTGLPDGAPPTHQGRKPAISVVVSSDTLLQLGDEPGHLVGYGPITAECARRLASEESGTWRRLLTDPDTGELLDVSSDTYRPSARLRAFVQARDSVCAFPTCNQPGYRCEFEHITEFRSGGRTCRCNGALACRRHNQCKIDSDWSYVRNADGSFTWTTAEGRQYRSSSARSWTTRSDDVVRPAPRPRPTTAALWAADDARYRDLLARWRSERAEAERAGDRQKLERAKSALADIRRQRRRQLAHRADPTVPPY